MQKSANLVWLSWSIKGVSVRSLRFATLDFNKVNICLCKGGVSRLYTCEFDGVV